jgi:hypothetical protein
MLRSITRRAQRFLVGDAIPRGVSAIHGLGAAGLPTGGEDGRSRASSWSSTRRGCRGRARTWASSSGSPWHTSYGLRCESKIASSSSHTSRWTAIAGIPTDWPQSHADHPRWQAVDRRHGEDRDHRVDPTLPGSGRRDRLRTGGRVWHQCSRSPTCLNTVAWSR